MYHVFTRAFWKKDPRTKKLVPSLGRKSTLCYCSTIEEARAECARYNEQRAKTPNPLSIKAEFTKE